jgi:hypothetical protein
MENYDSQINEIKVTPEKKFNFSNYDVLEAKFNIMTTLQSKAFDYSKYTPEDKIKIKNEKGEDEIKEIPLSNYIRWRYKDTNEIPQQHTISSKNENELDKAFGIKNLANNRKIESNARIVEWSDGSYQLIIGEEHFDIMFSNMDNVRFGVEDKDQNLTLINKPIKKRMILTPSEFSQRTNQKVLKQDENSQKVKVVYSYYDKQEYNKDEFSSKYGKKKMNMPLQKKDAGDLKIINKKRKRSHESF